MHVCNVCGYKTKYKSHMTKHKNRKYPCSPKKKFICEYCDKEYCRKYTLERHLKHYCKKKLSKIKEMEKMKKIQINMYKTIEAMKNELDNMKDEIKKKQSNITQNITNTTNITHNTLNVKMNVNVFNVIDHKHLSKKYVREQVIYPYIGTTNMIHTLYFHPKYPKNHVVKLKAKRDKFLLVNSNNGWLYQDKELVKNDIIQKTNEIMYDHFSKIEDSLAPRHKKNYETYQGKMDNDDPKLINKYKNDIDMFLLNAMK